MLGQSMYLVHLYYGGNSSERQRVGRTAWEGKQADQQRWRAMRSRQRLSACCESSLARGFCRFEGESRPFLASQILDCLINFASRAARHRDTDRDGPAHHHYAFPVHLRLEVIQNHSRGDI